MVNARQETARALFVRAATLFPLCCAATLFLIISPITARNILLLAGQVIIAVVDFHIMRAAYRTWSRDLPFKL
jgi:hypothetical protein